MVPALSISTTIYNLAAVVFRSLGNTVGILTGQMLGANRPKAEIRRDNNRQCALCVASGISFGLLTIALSTVFPAMYNTTDEVRHLAKWLIIISAIGMPLQAYIFPVYFTLRAGGRVVETFLFDCGAIWILSLPIAFVFSRFTGLSILVIFTLCQCVDILRCIVGFFMMKKGAWLHNLTV